MKPVLALATLVLLSPAAAAQRCAIEVDKLTASDAFAWAELGYSVAIEGDTLVAGAPSWNLPSTSPGQAYVFVRAGGAWSEQAKLVAHDAALADQFGISVSVSGERIAVGAPWDDDACPADPDCDSGSVYVFLRQGAGWIEEAKLVASDQVSAGDFGRSVALDGDTLLVGSPGVLFQNTGAAYVFVRGAAGWAEQQRLVPAAPAGASTGWSVDVDGDTALVGTIGGSDPRAYVFLRSGSAWSPQAVLEPSNPINQTEYGAAVALDGERALVGDSKDWGSCVDNGTAYVHERTGTAWSAGTKLVSTYTTCKARFGQSVALDGARLVVGAEFDDVLGSGWASVFEQQGGAWVEGARLVGEPGNSLDFGSAVALDGLDVVVGDPSDDTPMALGRGAAYVYRLIQDPAVYCTAKRNSCGHFPSLASEGVPSATAASGFVVTCAGVRAQKAGILIYTDRGSGSSPFQGGTLCLALTDIRRSVAVIDTQGTPGACDGELAIDMNAFSRGALGGQPLPALSLPGTSVHCQMWGRDTPGNSLLSDALHYRICP
jgi:hypothetical protein